MYVAIRKQEEDLKVCIDRMFVSPRPLMYTNKLNKNHKKRKWNSLVTIVY